MEPLTKDATLKLRKMFMGDSCKLFFQKDPIKILKAKGQYMFDEKGKRYLDCINNVAHVGHCDPTVVKAVSTQMEVLNTNSRFLYDKIVLCAEKIASLFPDPLSVVFFVNSGSEANDLALNLARIHTKNKDIICLQDAYHGHLSSLLEISTYKYDVGKFPQKEWVHVAPLPDTYRGRRRGPPDAGLGEAYARDVRDIIRGMGSRGLAGFIAESAPSCAGQMLLPQGYLRNVYRYVREAGGVCIADEVQVGFGRVGKHWWAFQLQGDDVIPDIVTLGKPIGNGFPVAAVVTTKEIAQSLNDSGMEYFNTFGGNAASCAAALAVIEVIESQGLRAGALARGERLKEGLGLMAREHPVIGDIRGEGLFIGVELVNDRVTREPATQMAQYVISRMKEEGIILSADGRDRNVIKIKPPMVFNDDNVDELLRTLEKIFNEVKMNDVFNNNTSEYIK